MTPLRHCIGIHTWTLDGCEMVGGTDPDTLSTGYHLACDVEPRDVEHSEAVELLVYPDGRIALCSAEELAQACVAAGLLADDYRIAS